MRITLMKPEETQEQINTKIREVEKEKKSNRYRNFNKKINLCQLSIAIKYSLKLGPLNNYHLLSLMASEGQTGHK